jgi:hypothetical protein
VNGKDRIRDTEIRDYDTPDGYARAIQQLSQRGYNYFLPIKKTRRKSALLFGKVNMPRSRATLH